MSRAQEILMKRREEMQKEKEEAEKEFNAKVEEIYNWILDLFENPTEFNTPYVVRLSNTYNGKIQIGYRTENGVVEKKFENEVMKKVADLLKEDGFKTIYIEKNGYYDFSSLIVKI